MVKNAPLSTVVAVTVVLGSACPALAQVRRVADDANSIFSDAEPTPKAKPKPMSKAAQHKRAALQQRVLLEQQQQRGRGGSVEQNLERLRQQQVETLRAQRYGQRYHQRHMPQLALPSTPADPLGRQLDTMRQQQNDTLRDQRQIQSQQRHETQRAIQGLRN